MIFKYKIIKSSNELKEYESVWKKLETGKEMTAFQSYDWNVLLVEQWLKFAYNRLLSDICIWAFASSIQFNSFNVSSAWA